MINYQKDFVRITTKHP